MSEQQSESATTTTTVTEAPSTEVPHSESKQTEEQTQPPQREEQQQKTESEKTETEEAKKEPEPQEKKVESEQEKEETKQTPTRRQSRKRRSSEGDAQSRPQPNVQTRSRTLKRDRDAVEADPQKKKLFEAFEPLAKKAKVTASESLADKPKRGRGKKSTTEITTTDTHKAIANLSEEDKAQLTMVFNMADVDKDGRLDIFELEAVLRNLGFRLTIQEVSQILREGDTDNSGTLELNEFLALMARVNPEEEKKEGGEEKKEGEEMEVEETETKSGRKRRTPKKQQRKTKTPTKKGKGTRVSPLQRGNSSLTLPNTNATLKLNRGLSITDFYTNYAGQHEVPNNAKKDAFDNPEGREYDLGRDGAFDKFTIVVGLFYPNFPTDMFMSTAGSVFQEKGFKVVCATTETDFLNNLQNSDEAWIVSDEKSPSQAFLDAIKQYHESGRGLALWADNEPWTATVNDILKAIQSKVQLSGNTPGGKNLTLGKADVPGQFGRHLLTSGIVSLFEGVTICFGKPTEDDWLEVLATSHDGNPCILYGDYEGGLEDHCGRVVIDCGFSKLCTDWNTAGTGRFVRNVCVWLLGLDHRLAIGAPIQGPIDKATIKPLAKKRGKTTTGEGKKVLKWVWQYWHDGWFNYDNAASDIVEATYQEYLKNPGITDVRAVKSGQWTYQVDFKNMVQQNIEHPAHTVRKIRRIQLPVEEKTVYSKLGDQKKKKYE